MSTIKLGAALVVYPVWAAGLVAAAFAALPLPLAVVAAAVVLVSPFAALRWLDAWYLRRPAPTRDQLAALVELRARACEAIDDARRRLPS